MNAKMNSKQCQCKWQDDKQQVSAVEDRSILIYAMRVDCKRTETCQTNENTHRKSKSTRWLTASILPHMLLAMLMLLAHGRAEEIPQRLGASTAYTYSQPLTTMSGGLVNDEHDFHPIIPQHLSPEYISSSVFTKSGHYRVFQPVESDLRMAVAMTRKDYDINERARTTVATENVAEAETTATPTTATMKKSTTMLPRISTKLLMDDNQLVPAAAAAVTGIARENVADETELNEIPTETLTEKLIDVADNEMAQHVGAASNGGNSTAAVHEELKGLEELLIDYVENFFNKAHYEPVPGLVIELQKNHSTTAKSKGHSKRSVRHAFEKAVEDAIVNVNVPRAVQSGRLLFVTGLKKVMWPIYMGLQVLKSLMFALFLPTIIGSVSRLIGKGITSGSAGSAPLFIRPMEAPQELDFKDNNFSFDDDGKLAMNDDGGKNAAAAAAGYEYNQAATQHQPQYTPFNALSINQLALSRYGMNERQQLMQDTYLSALQSIGAASFKNSQGISSGSSGALAGGGAMSKKPASPANMNTFQTFQKVPASSLLLSNYDPFYSPLLSRLDSVFAQLKLNSGNEICREKLICLMYANPTKYAPFSNLVSAQLSRELNELRKPTSDNPDILRFFKYMRAAKDGQDGVDCEQSFVKCKEFKDFENPAMVSTYNDINKLVQARKLT